MLITELLGQDLPSISSHELDILKRSCSQFLTDSQHLPLYKSLPHTYKDFHRVKVRQQKLSGKVDEAFNHAFQENFTNIRQRAIFASPIRPSQSAEHDPFYIFPLNGYKFLYSKEVKNSNADYQHVVDTLVEQFDQSEAMDLVSDILKYTYTQTNLVEGLESGSEIILYGVPAYYAVRVSALHSYQSLYQ